VLESDIVQFLTHVCDCGATFDRIAVHWSMLAEIDLSACREMDYTDKIWLKPDRIWIKTAKKQETVWATIAWQGGS
jgi:hypothetical protein